MRIDQFGNVGIGTTNTQGYALAVNGSAIFTKAVVKLYANWPDYVFLPEYRLPSLDSVSTYLRANHHLPEMPGADSVAKTGLDLGANQVVFLKKLEELTLYIIDQDKRIRELEEQNKQLRTQQAKIDRLEQLFRVNSMASRMLFGL
jgi:hypothetical protein